MRKLGVKWDKTCVAVNLIAGKKISVDFQFLPFNIGNKNSTASELAVDHTMIVKEGCHTLLRDRLPDWIMF